MPANIIITVNLIVPCGVNCALCYAHQRNENKCEGCNSMDENKPKYCRKCIIRNCKEIKDSKAKFCGKCKDYSCKRLKDLDKRYRIKYGMSMLENLAMINNDGIRKFVKREKERWNCSECGNILCVHRKECENCGAERVDL